MYKNKQLYMQLSIHIFIQEDKYSYCQNMRTRSIQRYNTLAAGEQSKRAYADIEMFWKLVTFGCHDLLSCDLLSVEMAFLRGFAL